MYKQANKEHVSYPDAVKRIIKEDGLVGLFGRGLSTKIMANGLQVRFLGVLSRTHTLVVAWAMNGIRLWNKPPACYGLRLTTPHHHHQTHR